jgi:hypothetical protein
MACDETEYRYLATSVHGVLQQLAACYLRDGYHFYVCGWVRERKDPCEVDETILSRYDIRIDKFRRARRKKLGFANVHYLRYERCFWILATKGEHLFYRREVEIRDVTRVPIQFESHSVSYISGHSCVRIHAGIFRDIAAYFESVATTRCADAIGRALRALPFVRFLPVRQQINDIWKEINRRRKAAGLDLVPDSYVRGGRKVCRPFGPEGSHADEERNRVILPERRRGRRTG